MIPRHILAVLTAGLVLAACTSSTPAQSTAPSFNPAAACAGADVQRARGAYPELETALPPTLAAVTPTTRESGRYCARATLGTLLDAGISEAHFGAATWDHGGGKAISLVLFEASGLTAPTLFESYQSAAAATAKVHDIRTEPLTLNGAPGHRMDLLNGESFQAILVWPGDRPGRVRVVISADLTNDVIQAAVDAFH